MDMQNVSNLQIPEGAVRTIHDKDSRLIWGRVAYNTKYAGDTIQNGAPTPDTPIPVQVVTGEQTVVVTGKNLFDKSLCQKKYNASYSETPTGLRVASTADNTSYVQIEIPNSAGLLGKTVRLSFSPTGSTTPNIVEIRGYQANQSGSISGQFFTAYSSITFTFPSSFSSGKDRFVFLFYTKNMTGEWTEYNSIQLEEGSTATTYESYQSQSHTISLDSIELCKIGDYQDYIYKSDNDWYLHKEVGKQIVDVSAIALRSNYSNIEYGTFDKPNDYGGYGAFGYAYPIVCTHAIHSSNPGNWNSASNIGRLYSGAESYKLWIGFAKGTGLDAIKTKLAGCINYYALGTPTDTQITDNTLIGQLNAVHQWLTRYGYNATVTGNLPIIVDRTNL